jgi:hypothetical protein
MVMRIVFCSVPAILVTIALVMVIANMMNRPPLAGGGSVTTREDGRIPITLTGTDPDGDQLTYSVVTGPCHGNLSGTLPNMIYTPALKYYGPDSFTFTVKDGRMQSEPATISIVVKHVNHPPAAKSGSVTTQEDTPVPITLTGTDPDGDTLTYSVAAPPTNGRLSGTAPNLLYSPNANFYGTDAFTYAVSDGKGGTHTATVSVTVNAVNDAPAITSTPVTTATAGKQYSYDVDAADQDSGDVLAYSLTTKPAGMAIDGATGLIEWLPTKAQMGTSRVEVRVVDSGGVPACDTQSFTVMVERAPPQTATLTVVDGYDARTEKTLSADGKVYIVQGADNDRWEAKPGFHTVYDFSDVSIPADAAIKSVVVYVEHFEEEQFAAGKLQWSIGTGWPRKAAVWASINPPVHQGEKSKAVDAWNITSIVDTPEKINSLQLQVKNNDDVAAKKTFVDFVYTVVEWQ